LVGGRHLALLAAMAASAGCAKKKIECFDVTAENNSAGTRAVFEARRCQGGGVTWEAILRVLMDRRGSVEAVEDLTPGWTGAVYTLNGHTRFSLDAEGSAVQLCADDPGLVAGIRREYERLNSAGPELKRVMERASADDLECDGRRKDD